MEQVDLGRYKNRIFNIAIIIIALIVALVIYRKQVRDIEILRDTKDEETKKNIVLHNIGKLEKRIDGYRRLLKDKDAEVVISNITDMAKESGIKVVSVRPGTELKLQDYTKLPLELELNAAEYHSLGGFISKLESHMDVYIIEDVRINSRNVQDGLAVTLKISSIEFVE